VAKNAFYDQKNHSPFVKKIHAKLVPKEFIPPILERNNIIIKIYLEKQKNCQKIQQKK
jgi:hypothetical protein